MIQKLIAVISLGLLLGVGSPVQAANPSADGKFGLGIILGQPSGLVAKLRTNSHSAVDFGLAYASPRFFQFYVDYLYHFNRAFGKAELAPLTPYLGMGGVLQLYSGPYSSSYSETNLGIRVPIGLEWLFSQPSIGLFLEIVPGVGILPSTYSFLNGGIGARYYF